MNKIFCDVCGTEIPKGSDHLVRELGRFKAMVTVALNGMWNDGDVCEGCTLKILNEGKPCKPTASAVLIPR
jgi:hypothetical protein